MEVDVLWVKCNIDFKVPLGIPPPSGLMEKWWLIFKTINIMSKKTTIKNMYSDVLYWAASAQTKKVKEYHITRTEEAVLRKFIHYSQSNVKITYSNEIISKHTFIGVDSLKKVIPSLQKKGYISIALFKIFDKGAPITRRTIYIKWDFIQSVLNEVPVQEEGEPQTAEIDIPMAETIDEVLDTSISELELKPVAEIEVNNNELDSRDTIKPSATLIMDKEQLDSNSTASTYPFPDVIITHEKLNWLKAKYKQPELTKSELQELEPSEIRELFYGSTGTWRINETSMENQYLIKYVHRGGSKFSLYNKNQSNDSISISVEDFNYTLEVKGIKFSQVTPELYYNIKSNGLLKRPDSIKGIAC